MNRVNILSLKLRQTLRKSSEVIFYVNDLLSLGIERRQFVSIVLICLMLLPVFALPINGRSVHIPEESGVEPVNEDLPIWTETWRSIYAKYEIWETSVREVNRTRKDHTSKIPKISKKNELDEIKIPAQSEEKGSMKIGGVTIAQGAELNSKEELDNLQNNQPKKDFLTALNQLPADEQGSVYEYENNLGNPRYQTELEPANSSAAATRIRHRPGVGNFSFDVPLAELSGRGMDAGISMSYNSRTWNVSCTSGFPVNQCNPANLHFKYDVEESWIAPGFSSGFGYLESSIEPNGAGGYYVTPRGVVQPSGSRAEFVCTSFFSGACQANVTKDGTFLKTVGRINTFSSPNVAAVNFAVSYPNGMVIQYAGAVGTNAASRKHFPVLIRDRNGNMIRIIYKSNTTDKIDYIQDTLGRHIKFYYENDIDGQPDKLVAVTIPE